MCSTHEPLTQARNRTNEDGESQQQTHYFHFDQIDIPREMTDGEGNLGCFGDYYGWGKLKSETNIPEQLTNPSTCKTSMLTVRRAALQLLQVL